MSTNKLTLSEQNALYTQLSSQSAESVLDAFLSYHGVGLLTRDFYDFLVSEGLIEDEYNLAPYLCEE